MYINGPFTKENLEGCLKELAKEYKKRGRGTPAEMILVGGASILINYEFRNASYDIDASYESPAIMKEAINAVGDKFGLPNGWLNDDFKKTISYTPKIVQYSEYYKTFSNVLKIRTIRAEYLVAMKLVSGRQYKNDLSDVTGIVYEQQLAGNPLTYEMIDKAICNLYGNWDNVSNYARELLIKILACEDLQALFIELSEYEKEAKEVLSEMIKKNSTVVKQDNINDVIAETLEKKRQREEQ
ncbi:MAG: hypothetical protein K2J93_02165 [Anaeroplasmataceae bacterium]|nr:hypothetical protein [Anaeroplasmataceae bacterium]